MHAINDPSTFVTAVDMYPSGTYFYIPLTNTNFSGVNIKPVGFLNSCVLIYCTSVVLYSNYTRFLVEQVRYRA